MNNVALASKSKPGPDLSVFGDQDLFELEKELCRTSLKYLCLNILGMKDWDTCHDDLETWLKGSTKRCKLILIPRGHLKSSILTIGLSIQHILNDPDTTILLCNAVWDNARSFLSEIGEYLTNKSRLPHLFGRFDTRKWTQDEVIISQRRKANKTPTLSTAGIDKSLASQHYKIIFADDLVNRQTVYTDEQRDKVKKYYSDLLDLLEPNGTLYTIGTRWHDADLYGMILGKQADLFDTYVRGATEDGTIDGKVIFPKKFSTQKLYELLKGKDTDSGLGSFEFYAQYFNKTINPDSQQFKPPIRRWTDLGEGAVHTGTVDLAISEKTTADYSVVMDAARTRANQLCVVDYVRRRMGPFEVIEKIFDFAQRYKWRRLGVESVAYQRVMVKLLEEEQRKRNIFFEIVPIYHSQDKFTRIMGLQPMWESGNLLLKDGMIELEDELQRFPVGERDDVIDALAMQLVVSAAPRGGYSSPSQTKDGYNGSFWKNGAYIPIPPWAEDGKAFELAVF